MTEQLNRLGFVGFGAMAQRMAARLKQSSRSVIAFDPAIEDDMLDGVEMVRSAKSLAGRVDAILVCVPNDNALRESLLGDDGALAGSRSGQPLINFSTVSPDASKAAAKAASDKDVRYVEAPMSGSTPQAESGDLVFLAGGAGQDLELVAPVLAIIGRKTVHIGSVGHGAVSKLVVNGVMALGTAALAEGLAYGVGAGLDRQVLIDMLGDLILVSEHHKHKLEMAKEGRYPAEFPTRLMIKDLGLLLADGLQSGATMPTMAAASQIYSYAGNEHGDDDYSSVIEALEKKFG